MKRVGVIQSNYLPWKGYFDIIHDVDEFVFYDDVQYTKNDWRNRNRIKTPSGLLWITVPVEKTISKPIDEVMIANSFWQFKQFKTLAQYYSRAPFFESFRPFLETLYLEKQWTSLSQLNQWVITTISREFLGLSTIFRSSREFALEGKRADRLLDLLRQAEADLYVSGPSARAYLDTMRFEKEGIRVVFKDYSSYPEYSQFYPPFEHRVTVLDLLFHTGAAAASFIWGTHNG